MENGWEHVNWPFARYPMGYPLQFKPINSQFHTMCMWPDDFLCRSHVVITSTIDEFVEDLLTSTFGETDWLFWVGDTKGEDLDNDSS
jgi:hypothetical protein